jgi:hypothetical protein
MNWKFWGNKQKGDGQSGAKPERLARPQSIPEQVGRQLVVKLGKNPDWVWNLRAVIRKRQGEERVYDFRVFEDAKAAAKKIMIRNYTSLDTHPDLILFDGWFDKKSWETHIEEKGTPAPLPKAA